MFLYTNDHANFLNGTVELVEGNLSLVVDVEELELLSQESFFILRGWALLHEFGPHLCLETRGKGKDPPITL